MNQGPAKKEIKEELTQDQTTRDVNEFAPLDWIAGFALALIIFLIMFGLADSI